MVDRKALATRRGRVLGAGWRRSVFWRAAAVLVAVELLVVVLAVGLGAWFALDQSRELATGSVRLRLDALAEEIERRMDWTGGFSGISGILLDDLSLRFPDPVRLIDLDGNVIVTALPAAGIAAEMPDPPEGLSEVLLSGNIALDPGLEWAIAPLYDDGGFLAGGVMIAPLDASLNRELAPTQRALIRAAALSSLVVLAIALLLAAAATWALVRPLRRMAARVDAIGRGEYEVRVAEEGAEEFERLGRAINAMAGAVATSVDRLKSTDRMRRDLIANVGHDLKTPLAAVIGRLEEAARLLGEQRTDEAQRHISLARKQSDYLGRLVDDLFELSVLDVPDPPLRLEPVPLAELMSDVAARHGGHFASKGIELHVDVPADLPIIEADGLRLLRLMTNLLTNAASHTPEGGRVDFRAGMDEEWILIHVEDSGRGLPSDKIERLFERYYRGDDARTRGSAGTGLGLAIARAVAVAHSGRLSAENRPEGGARFVLALPRKQLTMDGHSDRDDGQPNAG